MNEITDQSQSASLENWYLTHSVLVVKEVIDEAKREKKKCPFFKVNYEKTYDSINWDILIYMLRRMGFCEEWVGWIRCCLESSSILVLVNESPIGEFKVQRGLRQGGKFVHFFLLSSVNHVSIWLRVAYEHSPCFLLEVFSFFCALEGLFAILKRR